jgi:hypothetical protein
MGGRVGAHLNQKAFYRKVRQEKSQSARRKSKLGHYRRYDLNSNKCVPNEIPRPAGKKRGTSE